MGHNLGAGPSGTKAEAESPLVNLELSSHNEASSDDESASEPSVLLLMVLIQGNAPSVGLEEGDSLVDWAWGTSKEWFLELKDGQRLRIPEGIRSVMPMVDDRLTRRVQQWVDEQRHGGSESTEEEIKWFGSEMELALVTKEDSIPKDGGEAMLVEPLAVVMPPEDETHVLAEVGTQVHLDWVL